MPPSGSCAMTRPVRRPITATFGSKDWLAPWCRPPRRLVVERSLHDPVTKEIPRCLREEPRRGVRNRSVRAAARKRHLQSAGAQISTDALGIEAVLGAVDFVPEKALRRVARLDDVHEQVFGRNLLGAGPRGGANEAVVDRRDGRRGVDGGG